MTAALCPGIYEPVDSKNAQHIIDSCRILCDGCPSLLATVLQSRFIADHSPFYWALTGIEAVSKANAVPPFLSQLIGACGDLSVDIQQEIVGALLTIDNDRLYQLLQPSLPHVSGNGAAVEASFTYSAATVTAMTHHGKAKISFSIPQFFDRLLVDGEIVLPAGLANGKSSSLVHKTQCELFKSGSLWTLKAEAVVEPSSSRPATWQFVLTERRTKYPRHPYEGTDSEIRTLQRDVLIDVCRADGNGELTLIFYLLIRTRTHFGLLKKVTYACLVVRDLIKALRRLPKCE